MTRKSLKLFLAALIGAVLVAGVAEGTTVLGAAVQWISSTNTAKSASVANPLPVQVVAGGTGSITALTCTTSNNAALSVTSETIFAANTARKSLLITNNDGSIAIHVYRGAGAAATVNAPKVPAGSSWSDSELDGYIYQGAITGLAASGAPTISAEECQ